MTSKRSVENKRDKKIHRTAKNRSAGEKEKRNQTLKTANTRKNNDTKNILKSKRINEKLNKENRTGSETEKQSNEKTLIIDDDDLEGMTVPPKVDSPSPQPQGARPEARADQGPAVRPARTPPPRRPAPQAGPDKPKRPPQPKSPTRSDKEESSEDEDDEEDSPVKQFSFPAYKILSGASVAPVQMYPQKVVINHSHEPAKGSWGTCLTGLFQNSQLTLGVRLLRLGLIWIFFRVLNKQTAWFSDMLGIDQELLKKK